VSAPACIPGTLLLCRYPYNRVRCWVNMEHEQPSAPRSFNSVTDIEWMAHLSLATIGSASAPAVMRRIYVGPFGHLGSGTLLAIPHDLVAVLGLEHRAINGSGKERAVELHREEPLPCGCCAFAGVSDVLERDARPQRPAEWHESSGMVRPTDIRLQIRMARRDELLLRRQFAYALLASGPGRSAEGLLMAFPFVA
jgi:hypothetical protein